MTKTQKTRYYKSLIASAQEPMEPQKFVRIHIQSRAGKNARSRKQRYQQVTHLLIALGIKRHVVDYSLIGNSIIELYVPRRVEEKVNRALADHAIMVIDNFDPAAKPGFEDAREPPQGRIVARLAKLLHRNRIQNMQKCILAGFDEEIKQLARKAAETPRARKSASKEYSSALQATVDTMEDEMKEFEGMDLDDEIINDDVKVAAKAADSYV